MRYDEVRKKLLIEPKRWLVTGGAGFVGSNLAEALLSLDQEVVVLDNYSTGKRENVEAVIDSVGAERAKKLIVIEGDIRDLSVCNESCLGIDYVLHQAALGSVPRSVDNPILTNDNNVTGFLNVLVAARDRGVSRMVYAASSSTYGDHPGLPKVETSIGKPLSPYAVTKYVNELYAKVFFDVYGLETVGLRYFNVFGRRQDPAGAYAAVIPKWTASLIRGESIYINGDGQTSRDFCYIQNVIQANILAAVAPVDVCAGDVFNVAVGMRITLNELFAYIKDEICGAYPAVADVAPVYRDFRKGDVLHSLADISKIRSRLGYEPTHTVRDGLREAMAWYAKNLIV